MAEAKKSPVDREELLEWLDSCANGDCYGCIHEDFCDCIPKEALCTDALAYIGYLEERLEEAIGHDA